MKELYKKDPKFFLVMLLIILVVVFFIGKFIYSEYKKNKQKQVLENSTTSTNVNGVNLSINLGSVAQQIHSAFYDNDWFGWTEDEDKAITVILGVPKALIPQLKEVYFQLYDKDLNQDFIQYTGDSYYKVSNLFN